MFYIYFGDKGPVVITLCQCQWGFRPLFTGYRTRSH